MQPRLSKDAGAALITVLVMLAVMAVLAAAVLDVARFSLRRMDNQRQADQARWYLLGAERYAAARAGEIALAAETGVDSGLWAGRAFTFPIDGGALSLTLHDGSNCFNLNSLVRGGDGAGYVANPAAQIELAALLALGPTEGASPAALAASLADYLDSDATPLPNGIEDEARAAGDPGRRAANTLIGDVSELLQVKGFTPKIVARLAPDVCVRPTSAPSVLNINTLTRGDAPVLSAVFGQALSLAAAEGLIAARPTGGWADAASFLADPRLSGLEISGQVRARFAVRPRFLVMTAEVIWRDRREGAASLIEIGPPSRVVRRVMGAQISEHSV